MDDSAVEMKLINDSEIIYHQMDNSKYHYTTGSHQFHFDKGIRVIDWPPYPSNLNPIISKLL